MSITIEAVEVTAEGKLGSRVHGQYATENAADALGRFARAHPDIAAAVPFRWLLNAHEPGTGPAPERQLLNWERDPMAEVSDGYLSNMAIQGSNLKERLQWQPQYCTQAHRVTPCPSCDVPLQMRHGRHGGFYHCPCGWKTSARTRKAREAEQATTITGWCGTRLVMRYNPNGVAYAGCPTCDPGP